MGKEELTLWNTQRDTKKRKEILGSENIKIEDPFS